MRSGVVAGHDPLQAALFDQEIRILAAVPGRLHPSGPVGEGPHGRLDEKVRPLVHIDVPVIRRVDQHPPKLGRHHAIGRRRPGEIDRLVTEGEGHRRLEFRHAGAHLADRHRLARGGGGFGKAAGETTAVEIAGPLRANSAQHPRQLELYDLVALFRRFAGFVAEYARHLRVVGDVAGGERQVLGESATHRVAEARQGLGGCKQGSPAHPAVTGVQRRHGAHAQGDNTAGRARDGQELQRRSGYVAAVVDHADAAAAQPHAGRQGHRHGEIHRDRRVGRVAAIAQHVAADHGGARLVGGHQAGETLDQLDGAAFLFVGAGTGGNEQSGGGQRLEARGKPKLNWRHAMVT